MLNELRLHNFKAFKDLELELRPFNLLSGINSVGKSTILQSLPHCTPESEATLTTYKDAHSFECEDGETRLFSLHTRFTPGAGRIFYVGHVGKKLPNVSY